MLLIFRFDRVKLNIMKNNQRLLAGFFAIAGALTVADGLEGQIRLRDDSIVLAGGKCESCRPEGAKKCDADNEAQPLVAPSQPCSTANLNQVIKTCTGEIGQKKAEDTPNSTTEIDDQEDASCPPPTAAYKCIQPLSGGNPRWSPVTGVKCGVKSACTSSGETNQDPDCADTEPQE